VLVNRDARVAGKSKYSLRKLVGLALDGIFSFSVFPLRAAAACGAVAVLAAVAYASYAAFAKLAWNLSPPGFTALLVAVLSGADWRVHRPHLRTGQAATDVRRAADLETPMQTNYARAYEQLYRRHWWWRAREEFVVAAIERHVREPGGRILDIGCGNGLFFPLLARFGSVEGIEPDAQLVESCDQRFGRIHIGRFDSSFRPATRYRLIVMLDVLEHLPDAEGALRHALQLLEPTGTLLLTVPAFRLLWTHHDDLNQHVTRYTAAGLRRLAARCGLRLDELRYFYHWLFPLKLAVRMKEACLAPRDEAPRVPAERVNRFCYRLSRLEQALCGRHSFPFGSSLLAVGGPTVQSPPILDVKTPLAAACGEVA
jgi:SAM-dependent methyltransferase